MGTEIIVANPFHLQIIDNPCSLFSKDHSWINEVSQSFDDPISVLRRIRSEVKESRIIKTLRILGYEKNRGGFDLLCYDYGYNLRLSECTDALWILDQDGYDYMVEEALDIAHIVFKFVGSQDGCDCFEIYLVDELSIFTKLELVVE